MRELSEERIRERAYALWQADGSPEGEDKHYWELAERKLAEEDDLDVSEEDAAVKPNPLPAGYPTH